MFFLPEFGTWRRKRPCSERASISGNRASFGADSYETQKVEGQWHLDGFIFRENMARLFVDVLDTETNRIWLKEFKARWKTRLQQIDLWMVSHTASIIELKG